MFRPESLCKFDSSYHCHQCRAGFFLTQISVHLRRQSLTGVEVPYAQKRPRVKGVNAVTSHTKSEFLSALEIFYLYMSTTILGVSPSSFLASVLSSPATCTALTLPRWGSLTRNSTLAEGGSRTPDLVQERMIASASGFLSIWWTLNGGPTLVASSLNTSVVDADFSNYIWRWYYDSQQRKGELQPLLFSLCFLQDPC